MKVNPIIKTTHSFPDPQNLQYERHQKWHLKTNNEVLSMIHKKISSEMKSDESCHAKNKNLDKFDKWKDKTSRNHH